MARRLGKIFPEFGEELAALSQTTLETARANLLRRAAEKLTAAMIEKRQPLQTVRKDLCGDELQSRPGKAEASLPPVLETLGDLRNPVARRDFGPNTRFLISPALREALTLNDGRLSIVRGGSQEKSGTIKLEFQVDSDGRSSAQMKQDGRDGTFHYSGEIQIVAGLRKLRVDALGRVFPANERATSDGAARSFRWRERTRRVAWGTSTER